MAQMAGLDAEDVKKALEAIIKDPNFRRSNQCVRLLTYLIDESLAGNAGALKEVTIASAVFGRDADFQGSSDNVVRVNAARLRKALQKYYDENKNLDFVVISLPIGTYRPIFITPSTFVALDIEASPIQIIQLKPSKRLGFDRPSCAVLFVIIAVFLIGAGLLSLFIRRSNTEDTNTPDILVDRTETMGQTEILRELAQLTTNTLFLRLNQHPNLNIIDFHASRQASQIMTPSAARNVNRRFYVRTFLRKHSDGFRLQWQIEKSPTAVIIGTGEVSITESVAPDHLSLIGAVEKLGDKIVSLTGSSSSASGFWRIRRDEDRDKIANLAAANQAQNEMRTPSSLASNLALQIGRIP